MIDPNNFNYILGGLIVANVGTIGSIVLYGAKFIWWIAKLDSRVTENEKDINAAHEVIRTIKGDKNG